MNDPLRIGPRNARRASASTPASVYYRYAQRRIRCDSALCQCPARGVASDSFVFVSEERRLIYFAVPKCGTTTILHELFGGRHAAPSLDPERDLGEYLKFTFVRNPWERMVSNWKMFTTEPPARAQLRSTTDRDLRELASFESFVAFTGEAKNHHWQPQTLFLPEPVDFVGRLETFARDFERLCSLIGRSEASAPRRRSAESQAPYWEHYTPELVETVARDYSADVEAFGYEFART